MFRMSPSQHGWSIGMNTLMSAWFWRDAGNLLRVALAATNLSCHIAAGIVGWDHCGARIALCRGTINLHCTVLRYVADYLFFVPW